MKKLVILLAIGLGYYAYTHFDTSTLGSSDVAQKPAVNAARSSDAVGRAFDRRQSNVQVQGAGVVDKILSDDNQGSRHQRFIVRMVSGQTVLIAHNIDIAPRVRPLAVGDEVQFNGEYDWNDKGGLVHWTHRDPQGRHEGGWIKRAGKIFQ